MDNQKVDLDCDKWDFMHEEILAATVAAAFMFGRVYTVDCKEKHRKEVRAALKAELRNLGEAYRVQVKSEQHVDHIVALAERMTANFANCLRVGRFRVGIAQKALNLYLKYLWCQNEIATPPHCPFDSLIVGLLPKKVREPYTKLDDISVYRTWVKEAEALAGSQSLAEWELEAFEKLRN